MSKLKKVVCTDEPIEKINLVSDFLPHPHELALKKEIKKVTLPLTKMPKTTLNIRKPL